MNWQAAFPRYDADHPRIWDLFLKFTTEMIAAGHKQVSQSLILGRIRYEAVLAKQEGDMFKINQNYGAYYARKFISLHPEHEGLFSFRTVRGRDIFEGEE